MFAHCVYRFSLWDAHREGFSFLDSLSEHRPFDSSHLFKVQLVEGSRRVIFPGSAHFSIQEVV